MTVPYTPYYDPGTGSGYGGGYTPSPYVGDYWNQYVPPAAQQAMQYPQYQTPPTAVYNPAAYQANVPPPQTGAPNWWQNMIQAAKKAQQAAYMQEQNAMRARSYGQQAPSVPTLYGMYNPQTGYTPYSGSPEAASAVAAAQAAGGAQAAVAQAQAQAQAAQHAKQNAWVPTPDQYGYGYYDPGTGSVYGGAPTNAYGAPQNWGAGGNPNYAGAPATPAPSTGYGGGGYGGYGGYPSYPSYSAPTPGVDRWLYGILNWRIGTGV